MAYFYTPGDERAQGRRGVWEGLLDFKGGYRNPYQKGQLEQGDLLSTLYDLQGRMGENKMGVGDVGAFGNWASGYKGRTDWQTENTAKDLLARIFGASDEQRQNSGTTYQATYDKGGNVTDSGNLGELQDLLVEALTSKYGYNAARFAASRLPEMRQTWSVGQGQANPQSGTFLDYIRSRYNVG